MKSRKSRKFVPLAEIRERLGFDMAKMSDHLRSAGVTPYIDPMDRRRRLIAQEDVALLVDPQPVTRHKPAA